MVAESSALVPVAPQAVWDYLIDFARWAEWMEIRPGVTAAMEMQASEQIGMGEGRKVKYSDSKKQAREFTVKEWLPAQALALESAAAPATKLRLTMAEKQPGSTQVTLRMEIEVPDGPLISLANTMMGTQKSLDITVDEMVLRLRAALQPAA